MDKILAFDVKISQKLRLNPDNKVAYRIASLLAHSGDSWWWLLGLLIVWLATLFYSPFWHYIAGVLAFSLLIEAALVLGLKFFIKRRRPEGEWGAVYRNTDPHSFPSGHAARAVLIAVMSWTIAPLWFGIATLIWAPLACAGRVLMGVHYVSDVLAGMVIGFVSGLIVVRLLPIIVPLINTAIPFAF
jgi:membrane-associated phospholipid phosphatase